MHLNGAGTRSIMPVRLYARLFTPTTVAQQYTGTEVCNCTAKHGYTIALIRQSLGRTVLVSVVI